MAFKIDFVPARGFVRMTPVGDFNFSSGRKLLSEVLEAGAALWEHEILVDCRHTHCDLSDTDIWTLAAECGHHQDAIRKQIAILVSPEDHSGKAEFFALCARNQYLLVHAVTTMDDAIEWLFPPHKIELERLSGTDLLPSV
jgi:hypothetical protein